MKSPYLRYNNKQLYLYISRQLSILYVIYEYAGYHSNYD